MKSAFEIGLGAFPLHLGHAIICSIFIGLCISQYPFGRKNITSKKEIRLIILSLLGCALALASWVILITKSHPFWLGFSSSIFWWSFLFSLASYLLILQNQIKTANAHLNHTLKNAIIQEQLLIHSVAQVKKNIDLKEQVRHAKRNNLRSQMNPHFLFNVLTGIQNLLLNEQGEKASHVFGRFRRLLAQGFMHNDSAIGSVRHELNHVEQYIGLESIRMSKPIGWHAHIGPCVFADSTPCPKFLIQPLVENAIWHGLSGLSEHDPQIQIHVFWKDESLVLQVHDNGKGIQTIEDEGGLEKTNAHQSRGTAIIRERLGLLKHPGKFLLRSPTELDPFKKGAIAEINLPLWALEPPPEIINSNKNTKSPSEG